MIALAPPTWEGVQPCLYFQMGEPAIQRVKVYRLNDEGLWDDKGTGHVSVELMEVRSERL